MINSVSVLISLISDFDNRFATSTTSDNSKLWKGCPVFILLKPLSVATISRTALSVLAFDIFFVHDELFGE